MNPGVTFGVEDLLLCQQEWESLVDVRGHLLCEDCVEWLRAWCALEVACATLEDEDRRRIRWGHYVGWHAGRLTSCRPSSA